MFFKNAIAYSGMNLISQVALFIQGFVLRRLLAPQIMGIWNLVGVVKGFVSPFTIGILSGALRELPILKGRGDDNAQADYRSVSLTYSLTEIALIAASVIIYAFFRKSSISYDEYLAIVLAAVLLFFTRFQESYTVFFQGIQLYVPLSRLLFINSLILAVFLPIGALIMGLWGVFLGVLIAEGLKAIWMFFSAKQFGICPKLKFDLKIFKKLASFSIYYKIADYPISLFLIVDLLWITKFMDTTSLAIYVMARSFFLQSSEITIRLGTVFMTRTFEQYGKGEDREKITADIYRFTRFQLLIIIPVVCWAIFISAPLLIRQITPLYVDGIYPMTILLLASFFDLRNNNFFTIWIAEKRLASYGMANVFSLAAMLTSISVCWFFLGNKTLNGIAISVVVGYSASFLYIMTTIGRELLGNKKIFKLLIQVVVTTTWTALILTYYANKEALSVSFSDDIVFSLKKACYTFILIMPIVLIQLKSIGIRKTAISNP